MDYTMAKPWRLNTSHLEKRIGNEEDIAKNYYYMRRINLMRYLLGDLEKQNIGEETLKKVADLLGQAMDTTITQEFNKIKEELEKSGIYTEQIKEGTFYKRYFKGIGKGNGDDSNSINEVGQETINYLAEKFNFKDIKFVENTFFRTKKGKANAQSADSIIGYMYEYFVRDQFALLLKSIDKYVNGLQGSFEEKIIDYAVKAFKNNSLLQSGRVQQMGKATLTIDTATRTKGKDFSVDVGYNLLDKNNKGNVIAEFPLRGLINVTPTKNKKYKQEMQTRDQILLDYINDPNYLKRFGFQVKRFNISNIKSFRLSPSTQRNLNKLFQEANINGHRATQSGKQALYTMQSHIYDNLIALLGPTLLGVMFGDHFIFMDEFIENFKFYHKITLQYWGEELESENQNMILKQEILPEISDSHLYMQKKRSTVKMYQAQQIKQEEEKVNINLSK